MNRLLFTLLGAPALTLSALASAHHSPAVFDRSKEIMVSGVVTEFRWGNPHSWIHLDVAADDAAAERWSIEMDPASHLARRGWRSTTVKPGDRVSVLVHPLRDEEKGGQYISITLPDGNVLDERSR
jgi:hypothetical protein